MFNFLGTRKKLERYFRDVSNSTRITKPFDECQKIHIRSAKLLHCIRNKIINGNTEIDSFFSTLMENR